MNTKIVGKLPKGLRGIILDCPGCEVPITRGVVSPALPSGGHILICPNCWNIFRCAGPTEQRLLLERWQAVFDSGDEHHNMQATVEGGL